MQVKSQVLNEMNAVKTQLWGLLRDTIFPLIGLCCGLDGSFSMIIYCLIFLAGELEFAFSFMNKLPHTKRLPRGFLSIFFFIKVDVILADHSSVSTRFVK